VRFHNAAGERYCSQHTNSEKQGVNDQGHNLPECSLRGKSHSNWPACVFKELESPCDETLRLTGDTGAILAILMEYYNFAGSRNEFSQARLYRNRTNKKAEQKTALPRPRPVCTKANRAFS
jgi:hypothetical protein